MIVFDGFQLFVYGVFLLIWVIIGLVKGFKKFNAWRKTGFCQHNFKLNRTNSYGQHHWHKCEKCGEERLK